MDTPIIYISGGLLGDFVNQLSIIQEKFLETGKKGLLYISNHGHAFRFGLERTYADTEKLIKSQPYIYDYKIYNGEFYHIDLSSWRQSELLYRAPWTEIYATTYNVPWAKHPWLHTTTSPEYKDKILVHCSVNRMSTTIDYSQLFSSFPAEKLLFITMDAKEHDEFTKTTGIAMPLQVCESLDIFVEAINSCESFIGNLSLPLAIAFALHKPCIGILMRTLNDSIHMVNFPPYIHFYRFAV